MTDKFEKENQKSDWLEDRLLLLKEDYRKIQMSEEQVKKLQKKMEEAEMADKKEKGKAKMGWYAVTAAAFVGAFLILPNTSVTVAHAMGKIPVIGQLVRVVTFRNYEYSSERNNAEIEVPEIKVEETTASQSLTELKKTTEEINAEIKEITDKIEKEFKTYMDEEEGYQNVVVKSEVLTTTEEYFTLKLNCYQGAGSGYEWNYYYTIDLSTGERLKLKDVFVEGADYITPISDSIKEQMQSQMDADENVLYWLNDEEVEEWNFKTITDETSFYINEKGNIVIAFDEGDVAPMSMGAVEFEIPSEVLEGIRK